VKLRLSSLSQDLCKNDLWQKRKRDPGSLQNRETTAAPESTDRRLSRSQPFDTTKCITLPILGIARFLM
jgi:hypothetical protein